MTPADRPKFAQTLVGLSAMKPGKGLTPEAIDVWWNAMQHWSLPEFLDAASHLARSVEFMPSPYHFEQLRKAQLPTAGEAWDEILQLARSSFNGEPDDPVAARALRAIGGLRAVAMSDTSKTQFLEKRFAEHYAQMQEAEDTRESVPQIAGPTR